MFPEAAAMIHNFYSEFGLLEEEIEEKSDLWATHGFVSKTHPLPLKLTRSLYWAP